MVHLNSIDVYICAIWIATKYKKKIDICSTSTIIIVANYVTSMLHVVLRAHLIYVYRTICVFACHFIVTTAGHAWLMLEEDHIDADQICIYDAIVGHTDSSSLRCSYFLNCFNYLIMAMRKC